MRRSARLSVLIAAALAAGAGRASADNAADAAALFDRGRALAKEGNHAEACPLFEQSLALLPALGTELNLALCWTAVGRLVDAAALFDGLIAKTAGPDQAKRHEIVVRAAETLAKRIPTLDVELPVGASSVRIDGKEAIEGPTRVDPGTHTIEADGAVKQTVEVVEGQQQKVVLVAASTREPLPPPPPPGTARSRLPWYVGGAGVGVLVIGTITGVVVLSRRDAGLEHCDYDAKDDLHCEPRGAELLDSARTLSHVTTGMFVVGGALLATGVVLEVLERKKHPVITGWVGTGGAGLAYERTW